MSCRRRLTHATLDSGPAGFAAEETTATERALVLALVLLIYRLTSRAVLIITDK